ncbi:MAG: thermonuclease family protein [Dissulfurispiraceae bacterium]|jgi:micrococcal nuclease|nr:thermonuclease family protein [Dissulfurispiraceae bacterium]
MLKYRVARFYYTLIFSVIIILTLLFSSLWVEGNKNIFLKKNARAAQENTLYRVTQVHDGDTVSIRISSFKKIPAKTERVRLIGIDAPEIKQEPWGRRSKKQLKDFIGKSDWIVSIELDLEQRDKYGRILGYLWDKKGRCINMLMVETGYAMAYTLPPNVKYADQLTEAQSKAREEKKGLWRDNAFKKTPRQWRTENPRI